MVSRITTISPRLALGIFMLYLPLYGNGAVSPAIAALSDAFPEESITLITLIAVMPNLTTIFGCLLVPILLRRGPCFRPLGIFALVVYGVFGVLPAFVNESVSMILIFRAICGFGVGVLFPLGAAIIMRLVGNKDERSKQLGRGQSVGQAGGIALTLLGGFLCSVSWDYTFLAYVVVFAALIGFIVFFRTPDFPDESEADPEDSVDGPASTPGKKGLPVLAWVFSVILMLMQTAYNAVLLYISPLLAAGAEGVDVSGTAGILLSMLTVAGTVGALLTGKLYKRLGRFAGPLTMILMGVCVGAFIGIGSSVPLYAAGFLASGFCFSIIVPLIVVEVGNWLTAAALALGSTVSMICLNAGNFLASYLLGFLMDLGGGVAFPVQASAVAIVALGVLWGVVNMFNRAYKNVPSF